MLSQDARLRNVTATSQQRTNTQARGPQTNAGFDMNQIADQQAQALDLQGKGHAVVPASHNPNASLEGVGPGGLSNLMRPGQGSMFRPGMGGHQTVLDHGMQLGAHGQVPNLSGQGGNITPAAGQISGQVPGPGPGQMSGQLKGQLGGLHTAQTSQQSPALPNLTRPLDPPDQPAVATPQQRPSHVPQGIDHNAPQPNSLMMSQQGGVFNQPRFGAANSVSQAQQLSRLPPQVIAKLKELPQAKRNQVLQQYFANNMNKGERKDGVIGQQNTVNQRPMTNAINPGAVPGLPFNSHGTTPLQRPDTGGFATAAHAMRPEINPEHVSPSMLLQLDQLSFPRSMFNKAAVPDNVISWGQLKAFVRENQPLSNISTDTLVHLQVLHYQECRRAMQNTSGVPGSQAGPQQSVQIPSTGGVAPQAPMTATLQHQPGVLPQRLPVTNMQMPSTEQIQNIRMQLGAEGQRLTDQQIINYVLQKQQRAAMENQRIMQEQAQRATNQNGAVGTTVSNVQTPQPHPPQPHPPQQSQQAQSRQQHPGQPIQQTPITQPMHPQSTGKVGGPGQKAPFASPGNNQLPRGTKRPANDGDITVNLNKQNQPLSSDKTPQVQQARSSQGFNITQEELARMNPHQQMQVREHFRAQMEARAQTQQLHTNNASKANKPLNTPSLSLVDPQRRRRYDEYCAELAATLSRRQPLNISMEERHQIDARIGGSADLFNDLDQIFPMYIPSARPDHQLFKNMLTFVSH